METLFLRISAFRSVFLCIAAYSLIAAGFGGALAAPSDSSEYTVRGTVASKVNFYDRSGKLTEPPGGVKAFQKSDFVFRRKYEKWRLDIKYPDPSFEDGSVWRTIIPLPEGGFFSLISFPPRPGVQDSEGNGHVTVITNQYFPSGDTYGAHAAWLAFNLNEVVGKVADMPECPPVWRFNPRIDDMRVNSHKVIRTNEGFLFWNKGRSSARDNGGNIMIENGRPKLNTFKPPLDQGFVDAEFRFSPDVLSSKLVLNCVN